MPEHRKSRIALIGPAAQALSAQMIAAGFDLADGGAALIDVAASLAKVPEVRRRYAPVVGILDGDSPAQQAETLDAVVRAPSAAADLPRLLRTLIRAAEDRDELQRQADDLAALVDVTAALAAGGDPDRLVAQVLRRIAGRLTVERCSVVLIDSGGSGTVVASSDDPSARGMRIDLAKYPEFREVMQTGRPLVIDDAQAHPLLDPVRERLAVRKISAIAVVPMTCNGAVAGFLFVRSRTHGGFSARETRFLCAVASVSAVALRNAGRIQSERRQRVAAERELSQLRRYEDFFSHVNDGMAVLDDQGRVLSVNPAGCAILGIQNEDARGLPLPELVAKESAMEASLLWRALVRGGRVLSADLRVQTRDGRRVTLSVSAGPLGARNGHAILSFRDVSESRELESELRKTKEFLERLIHATSDGIVAADLQGTLLLFNKGAERMTGFSAAALVGKWNIRELYPPGLAEQMMRRLREARAAGEEFGRVRCEIVAHSGEVIPVDLSAAIVTEDGRDTATVGVFRDLREELRRESELRKTRERLEEAEKAAVLSELAGAAAHELNQPLTSVLGFSELLFRRTREHEKGREELAAILREAERMAQIVKKIGRITRYETTAYVGRTRIVDLDRASNPPDPV
ncbi:MAG TPA: PAS domain S-box protein, partial [Myxococcales bacterium]|nr:PAS domain S-box protein [Myxococcales bacterium]